MRQRKKIISDTLPYLPKCCITAELGSVLHLLGQFSYVSYGSGQFVKTDGVYLF